MNDRVRPTEVLIIGAGPAGLATAVELAERGVAALVLERRPDSSDHPRATALTAETMATFSRWGVDQEVRRAGFESEHAMSIRPSLVGPELHRIAFEQHVWTCAQDVLEPLLAERAERAGAQIQYGWDLVGLRGADGGVVATLTAPDGDSSRTIRAKYLVGADGGSSAARTLSGITQLRAQEYGSWISIMFHAPLREYTGDPPFMIYGIGDPSTGGVIVPTDAADRWTRGIRWYPEHGERLEDYTEERCARIVRLAVGVADLPVSIAEVRSFRMVAAIADRYVAGRVVLAGDAGHVFTPSAGLGLNLAIHDGVSLGAALARALADGDSPEALEAYERQCRPLAEQLLEAELARA
jgi:putative polyketide hydroxylase